MGIKIFDLHQKVYITHNRKITLGRFLGFDEENKCIVSTGVQKKIIIPLAFVFSKKKQADIFIAGSGARIYYFPADTMEMESSTIKHCNVSIEQRNKKNYKALSIVTNNEELIISDCVFLNPEHARNALKHLRRIDEREHSFIDLVFNNPTEINQPLCFFKIQTKYLPLHMQNAN